jgi:hypothetical protein
MPCPKCYAAWDGLDEAGHLRCGECGYTDPVKMTLSELVARFIQTDKQLASVTASREFYFRRHLMHLGPVDHSSRNTSSRSGSPCQCDQPAADKQPEE